jgi:hypothetical protein
VPGVAEKDAEVKDDIEDDGDVDSVSVGDAVTVRDSDDVSDVVCDACSSDGDAVCEDELLMLVSRLMESEGVLLMDHELLSNEDPVCDSESENVPEYVLL